MEYIKTDKAPKAIGPYSQAVKVGNLLFVSGQIPIDPVTNQLIDGTIEEVTRLVLNNLKNIVIDAGFSLYDIAKVTIFLKDMDNFVAVNRVYEDFFGDHRPARAVVEVSRLPKDVLIEIECVAVKN
ncbi:MULTISPECIES: RidA family protein [Calditerrivibrio]|jgi:2-iminobutanoate/2-iminopropanoate deaminase|uniref:Reactive intermediate/imine deaminase n=1 Tax=Calditerrivibrio nitroreducens TaxID=477976 RepID=A0A2J6WQ53_9BACT|nr:MAG: reactive intermediate/imine deaminase [Calditerrivibrio nitroreducens]